MLGTFQLKCLLHTACEVQCSHGAVDKHSSLLGCDAVLNGKLLPTFQGRTVPPSSRSFRFPTMSVTYPTYSILHDSFLLILLEEE